MHAIADVISEPAFLGALAVSLGGSLLVLVLVLVPGGVRTRALPVGGLLIAAATAVGLVVSDALAGGTRWLLAGSLVLALGGSVRRALPAVGIVVLAAGAVGISYAVAVVDGSTWVRVLVIGATTAGALGTARVDRTYARFGLGPWLLAVTAAGVFVCVPDTEQAIPLFAASLGLLVALRPPASLRLGSAGAAVGIGLVLWAAAVGGTGRPGSVVGAAGCLGMLVVEPVVEALLGARRVAPPGAAPARPDGPDGTRTLTVGVVHVVVVLFCARVAGFRSSAAVAGVLVTLALVAAGVLLAVAWRPRR